MCFNGSAAAKLHREWKFIPKINQFKGISLFEMCIIYMRINEPINPGLFKEEHPNTLVALSPMNIACFALRINELELVANME